MDLVKIMIVYTWIDFSCNNFSGPIPEEVGEFKSLYFLNKIPTSTQFLTFPKAFLTKNKGLWGPPLTVDNKAGSSSPAAALNRSKQNSEDEIDWDLISIEIGFAFGFGVAFGSLVLCKRWSKWYYEAMHKIVVNMFPQLEERIGRHRSHVHINQRFN
ncbi:hypothetical protein DVH24_014803 [Malus domestica]|uniref:Uncharacterized protein n=1 Tax=Malus domestica TaxID=3750 RepID=A0A498K5B9_MALDO|nr:hypothetical protein DVH24_014803 [Malus domestica]